MRQLSLHVGHGKTGSSYLQSVFALARDELFKSNILYPNHNSFEDAKAGKITSGNGVMFNAYVDSNQPPDQWYAKADHIFFSSEFFFPALLTRDGCDRFLGYLEAHAIEQVNILLFIRNPIEQITSGYQQFIKRAGGTQDIDTYSKDFKVPGHVRKFVDCYHSHEHIRLKVFNYSRNSHDLAPIGFNFLGTENFSTLPPDKIVNRGLTYPELWLQRQLNAVLGKSGHLIADPLCNLLPDIKGEKLYPSLEAQQYIIDQNYDDMTVVNKHIDEAQHYTFDLVKDVPPVDTNSFHLSGEQLEVIAQSLGAHIQALQSAADASSETDTDN